MVKKRVLWNWLGKIVELPKKKHFSDTTGSGIYEPTAVVTAYSGPLEVQNRKHRVGRGDVNTKFHIAP